MEQADVAAAVSLLQARGRPITIRGIRAIIGHGSFRDIQRYRQALDISQALPQRQEDRMEKQRGEKITITPTMAAAWLARNQLPNRPLKRKLRQYAQDMRNGQWVCNGETIVLDQRQNILDGQNRLHAIVQAGVAIETWVVFNMAPETFTSFNQGRSRTFGDVCALSGETQATILAGSVFWLWRQDHGYMNGIDPNHYPSRADLEDTLACHPTIRQSISHGAPLRFLAAPSLMTACHYWFTQAHPQMAEQMFQQLESGLFLTPHSQIYRLRERLLRQQKSKARISVIEVAALIIKAWNDTVTGKRVKQLKWKSGGNPPEPFPMIAGYHPHRCRIHQGPATTRGYAPADTPILLRNSGD